MPCAVPAHLVTDEGGRLVGWSRYDADGSGRGSAKRLPGLDGREQGRGLRDLGVEDGAQNLLFACANLGHGHGSLFGIQYSLPLQLPLQLPLPLPLPLELGGAHASALVLPGPNDVADAAALLGRVVNVCHLGRVELLPDPVALALPLALLPSRERDGRAEVRCNRLLLLLLLSTWLLWSSVERLPLLTRSGRAPAPRFGRKRLNRARLNAAK